VDTRLKSLIAPKIQNKYLACSWKLEKTALSGSYRTLIWAVRVPRANEILLTTLGACCLI
jgi:hypothetical protein